MSFVYHSRAADNAAMRVTVTHHKYDKTDSPLRPVWVVVKYWGHGGYEWYAVMDDGALLCAACVKANYRQIVRDTLDKSRTGWQVIGFTNNGDMGETEWCAHCNRSLGPDPEDK